MIELSMPTLFNKIHI